MHVQLAQDIVNKAAWSVIPDGEAPHDKPFCSQVPGLSQEHQVLALTYAAEALCHVQGTSQAAQQLQKAIALQGVSSNGNRRQSDAANSKPDIEVRSKL